MRRAIRRGPSFLAAALTIIIASPVLAWAPQTRAAMIDDAIRLMPEGLRIALEAHRRPVLRGMLDPLVDEAGAAHRPSWDDGTLEQQVARAAAELQREILTPRAPFETIALRLGTLAHYVADGGFPPGASSIDGDRRYAHFRDFCESRRERFPLVFYGHHDDALADGDFGAFARSLARRAAADDERLARAYAAAGDSPGPDAFDDRSVPFAVGSLSYSRSVTSIVQAWLTVWGSAGGDLQRTPYWQQQPTRNTPAETRP